MKDSPVSDMEEEGVRYVVCADGTYLQRKTNLYQTSVKVGGVDLLEEGEFICRLDFPALSDEMVRQMVGFFSWAYNKYGGEAALILCINPETKELSWYCPDQHIEQWESTREEGKMVTGDEIHFDQELPDLPEDLVQLGDAHSHGNFTAYTSHTDSTDEEHKDGIHIVVGRVNDEAPDYHAEFAIDGARFSMEKNLYMESEDVELYGCEASFPHGWKGCLSVKQVEPPTLSQRGVGQGWY